MRRVKILLRRGWKFEAYMGDERFFYVSFYHNTWGDAEGASDNFNTAIEQAYEQALELEKAWE